MPTQNDMAQYELPATNAFASAWIRADPSRYATQSSPTRSMRFILARIAASARQIETLRWLPAGLMLRDI